MSINETQPQIGISQNNDIRSGRTRVYRWELGYDGSLNKTFSFQFLTNAYSHSHYEIYIVKDGLELIICALQLFIFFPTILLFGMLTNLLILIVMTREAVRVSRTAKFYFILITIFDLLHLILMMIWWIMPFVFMIILGQFEIKTENNLLLCS